MPEKLQNTLSNKFNSLQEWWKKCSIKQRTLLVTVIAVIVVALAILAAVVSRPKMVTLITCEDTKQASQVKELLEGENIKTEISQDGLTFSVNAKDESSASILLGSNNIPTAGYLSLIHI